MATTCIYEKCINYNKNLELNISKNSELKNSIKNQKEDKDAIPVCSMKWIISKYSEFSIKKSFFFSLNCAKGYAILSW